MESALYGIYALVVFVSEILLVRCAHSFDLYWFIRPTYTAVNVYECNVVHTVDSDHFHPSIPNCIFMCIVGSENKLLLNAIYTIVLHRG